MSEGVGKSVATAPKVEVPKTAMAGLEKQKKGLLSGVGTAFAETSMADITGLLKGVAGVGIAVAIAGAVVKGFKQAFEAIKGLVSVYDPIGTDAIMSRMNASISKMKSALGKALMPTFEKMADIVGGIADGITTVMEGLFIFSAFMQGLQGNSEFFAENCEDAKDSIEEASEAANEGLAAFDKLNTLGDLDVSGLEEAEHIKQIQKEAYENGQKAAKTLEDTFFFGIPSAIGATVQRFNDDCARIGEQFGKLWSDVQSWGEGAWNGIKGTADAAWTSIKTWAGEVDKVVGGIADALKGAWSSFTSAAGSVWTTIEETIKSLGTKIGESLKTAIESALGWIYTSIEWVKGVLGGGSSSSGGSSSGGTSGDLFAEGGMLGGLNPLNWGNLAGNVASGIGDVSQSINVSLDLDGYTLVRETFDNFLGEASRRGINLLG